MFKLYVLYNLNICYMIDRLQLKYIIDWVIECQVRYLYLKNKFIQEIIILQDI